MRAGARTPEELEALLEDAFVTRDADALSGMFTEGAVLALGDGPHPVRGVEEIARLASARWARQTYIADPRRVVQARDTALVLAGSAVNVARRGGDGTWRYAIALVSLEPIPRKDQP